MDQHKHTVMVIEDEELLRDAITRKLAASGIQTLAYESGKKAVEEMDSLENLPDAIWLDYYLPDMNGIEFMQIIKRNPKFANIPVIVVSNSANPQKVSSMLGLGAKKYILKAEHRLDDIIDTIQTFIHSENAQEQEST